MAGNKPPELEPRERPDVRDIDSRTLTRFMIVLVLGGILTLLMIFLVFAYFKKQEAALNPPPAPGMGVEAGRVPPEPRLQASPTRDLKQMREAEDRILTSYAWLDPDHGVVRIPISRAIDLLAQRGLPSRPEAGPQTASSATVPTESGLGPIVQQVGGPLNPNRSFPPDQPLEIKGTGSFVDGRQAGGPPTPPQGQTK
jgi:hypothetical protein